MGPDVIRGLYSNRPRKPRAADTDQELAALTALDAPTFERP